MRYLLFASAAVAVLTIVRPPPAHALFGAGDIVVCPTCSSLVDQLAEKAVQAKEYATQAQQYATQLDQYRNMVTNTVTLPTQVYSQVAGTIMQVRSLANAASLLTGNSGSILTRLQMAGGYANQAATMPSQIGGQFTMWQQTIGQANNAMARTLGVQQGQEQNNAALQQAIQAHSASAVGQMQAIQAGNELAALTNTQLQQIQTTLTAAVTARQTTDIVAADRAAAQDQAMQNMLTATPIPLTGYTSY